MAGIGSYKKGKAFALKSGNKPLFKSVGAVEAIKQVDTSKNMNTQKEIYKAKLRGDYQDLTGDKLEKASYDDPTGTVVSKGFSIPDSPAKTHKPGHKKGAQLIGFDDTIIKSRKDDAYKKRKEELLNQGFTQKDADQMIKSGATTGKTKGKVIQHEMKHDKIAKPTNIKTIQNKKTKGGKLTKAEKRQLDEYRIHVTEQNK